MECSMQINQDKNFVTIILTADRKYFPHLLTTIKDIRKHTSLTICVYTENPILLSILLFFSKNRNVLVKRVVVSDSIELPISLHASKANYYRLFAFNDAANSFSKAIYLDCDIRIKKDITPLINYDMKDSTIAMVPHFHQDKERQNSLCVPIYFNSGIIVVDLLKWLNNGCLNSSLKYIENNQDKIRFWDQDVLNAIFVNKIAVLPYIFNVTADMFSENNFVEEAIILHFTGMGKPWLKGSDVMHKKLYYAKY